MKHILKMLLGLSAAFVLLHQGSILGKGIAEGMALCVEIVIPSLFPFMVFTSFLSLSGWSRYFSSFFSPLIRYCFRLPEAAGTAVFMSFIGGYPVGARMIARLMKENKISPQDGERMLSFCVNAGPSFVLTAVGVGMFHNRGIGMILFMAHILAALTMGIVSGIGKKVPEKEDLPAGAAETRSAVTALIQSVSDSASGMLTLSAFVILFSGILSLLQEFGPLIGLLEVTKGCLLAAETSALYGELMAAFLLSFGGLSVICQAAAGFSTYGEQLHFDRFLLRRVLCGGFSCGWYSILRVFFRRGIEQAASVYGWMPTEAIPVPQITDTTLPLTICLLAVCAIAAMTLDEPIS